MLRKLIERLRGRRGGQAGRENRRDARHKVNQVVVASHPRVGLTSLLLVDISAGGAQCEAAAGLRRGDRVMVDLPLEGERAAEVMWSLAGRAGLRFAEPLAPDALRALITIMRFGPTGDMCAGEDDPCEDHRFPG